MSKHTPGPWMVHRYVTGNGIAKHVGTVGCGLVASVGDHDARCGGLHKQYASACYEGLDRMAVMDANAALIADAPRLARMAETGEELVRAARQVNRWASAFLSEVIDAYGADVDYPIDAGTSLAETLFRMRGRIQTYEEASK